MPRYRVAKDGRSNSAKMKTVLNGYTILRVFSLEAAICATIYFNRLLLPGGLIMSDSRRRFRSAPLPFLAELPGP